MDELLKLYGVTDAEEDPKALEILQAYGHSRWKDGLRESKDQLYKLIEEEEGLEVSYSLPSHVKTGTINFEDLSQ